MLLQRFGVHRWVRGRTFRGDSIRLVTGEPISKAILAFGYSELALSALLIEFLQPGMCFVDVGAHLGYEAMLASVLVGPRGRVISFEPQRQIVQWTALNLMPYPQARVVEAAAGSEIGTMRFSEQDIVRSAFSGQGDKTEAGCVEYQVELTKIGAALREGERPVHAIKCDAEGADVEVLHGALDILREDRPILVVEVGMPGSTEFEARLTRCWT
jgi:FkbM family methyltransferase